MSPSDDPPTAQVFFERGPHGPASDEQHGTASLPYSGGARKESYIQQKKAEYAPWLGTDGTGIQS